VSTPKPHRLLVAGVGALTAAAMIAGCSSSKKAASADGLTGTSTSGASSAGASGAAGSLAAGGGASGGPSAEATKSFSAGSGKGSKFCNELGVIAAQEAKLSPTDDTPADTKKAFDEIKSLKAPLEGSAPSSIKADLGTMFDYISKLDGVLAKAGYDYSKINPTDLASFETDAQNFETASQNVDSYVTQACGINMDGDSSPSN
jgi:hypothetical protein